AASAGSDGMTFEQWLEAKGFDADTLSDEQQKTLQAAFDAEQAALEAEADDEETDIEAEEVDEEEEVDVAAEATQAVRAAAAAETKRINRIREVCKGDTEIEAKAIEAGWTPEKAELTMLRKSRATGPQNGPGHGGAVSASALEAA